jgi:hypothetical protein
MLSIDTVTGGTISQQTALSALPIPTSPQGKNKEERSTKRRETASLPAQSTEKPISLRTYMLAFFVVTGVLGVVGSAPFWEDKVLSGLRKGLTQDELAFKSHPKIWHRRLRRMLAETFEFCRPSNWFE